MPATLRELRQRRKSVSATKKITRAMELIAASRIISPLRTRPPGSQNSPRAGASFRRTSRTAPRATMAMSTQAMGTLLMICL